MLIFVSGGVRSGKSALGEQMLSAHEGGRRVYLATSEPYDGEMEERIARHRQDRAGKGFTTVERSRNVGSAADELQPGDAVLLDCLGTLASNEMFGGAFVEHSAASVDKLHGRIMDGIGSVRRAVSVLVVVSNEIFSDGVDYDPMTADYIMLMGRLHRSLAEAADTAIECVYGRYIVHKGEISSQ